MRDMTNANASQPPAAPARRRRLVRFRPWIQAAFLAVWLGPFGLRLHSISGCVFHCYACPLATLACPIGVIAQFAALPVFPLIAVGILVAVGGMVGSLLCGWACPFGFLQDLIARIPLPKFRIPGWMGHGRILVLAGAVVLVPMLWGEGHPLFICRWCPAGALEAAVPNMVTQAARGQEIAWMSSQKFAILAGLLLAAALTYRPWCTVLCPLGGVLSLFNRFSIFHLRFAAEMCTDCRFCRSQCSCGIKPDLFANESRCTRCLECTTCGAISPSLGLEHKTETISQARHDAGS
jgi:polyferredoxin